ncbi:MAG: diaminopimelate epimerase [Alphaproteobacteria bacterium]|nr:diaminopimelate epimerase [Alphaproteobacteria bacterium]OJV46344.1 MAG: diaminopimelate epimerase [Alphaproteobacteria bacterium 43-37]
MHFTEIPIPFFKMHGTGNDFVLFDCRSFPMSSSYALMEPSVVQVIAHRQLGVGCDQVIFMLPPKQENSLSHVRFFNTDGSESAACGNGARCVAWMLKQTHPDDSVCFSTNHDFLHANVLGSTNVEITMGKVIRSADAIPLSKPLSPNAIDVGIEGLPLGACGSIGNPHIVFFVDNIHNVPVKTLGPLVENHPLFLKRINVHFAEIQSPNFLKLRTWERGSGMTLSCGSGACVAAAIASELNLVTLPLTIHQSGGSVICSGLSDGTMTLTGPVSTIFKGGFHPEYLENLLNKNSAKKATLS